MKNKTKYKIVVSGAADVSHCCSDIKELCREIGREIVRQGCVLLTGATTGARYFSAQGCKEEGGMSIGFSTTTLALAAKRFGGTVTTIEIDESMVEVARKAFEREAVSDNIEIIVGDAIEVLAEMESETFDVVFQDSTKRGYPVMLVDCIRVLKKGGLFLVDDTLWPPIKPPNEWNDSYKAIDKFNRELSKLDVISTILPIGEGCTIAVKL